MNILYISHLHPPENRPLKNIGGMQKVSMQLVDELEKRPDIEIHTIIMKAAWSMIEVKAFFFLLTLLKRIPAAVKRLEPDVILFSSMVTASISPLLRNRVDVPMVTINHGQDVTLPVKLYQRYLPKVFNSLDGVISVSSATRQQCIERGMGSKKGIALPNGFDLESMERLPEKSAARKEMEQLFNIDLEDKFLLLSVGRQVKRKGHQWFVETVFERIQSDVIYLLIGDGPEHENIGKAVERIRNGGEIILAGKQPDKILSAAYAAADLFIMPNIPVEGDMEGFGIVLLEANRAAVPAVASDLEGIKDVIEQGVNGYRVPHSKPEKFADKIDFVLKNELNELSEHSLSYVKESFSWQHVAEKYVSYLQTVIERKE